MAKTKTSSKAAHNLATDAAFLFKLVLFLVLGSQWLYLVNSHTSGQLPLPLGALIGIGFILKEPNRSDRKIEYALLLVAMFVGFWLPLGITIVK
jgi:hypothetical protein